MTFDHDRNFNLRVFMEIVSHKQSCKEVSVVVRLILLVDESLSIGLSAIKIYCPVNSDWSNYINNASTHWTIMVMLISSCKVWKYHQIWGLELFTKVIIICLWSFFIKLVCAWNKQFMVYLYKPGWSRI